MGQTQFGKVYRAFFKTYVACHPLTKNAKQLLDHDYKNIHIIFWWNTQQSSLNTMFKIIYCPHLRVYLREIPGLPSLFLARFRTEPAFFTALPFFHHDHSNGKVVSADFRNPLLQVMLVTCNYVCSWQSPNSTFFANIRAVRVLKGENRC